MTVMIPTCAKPPLETSIPHAGTTVRCPWSVLAFLGFALLLTGCTDTGSDDCARSRNDSAASLSHDDINTDTLVARQADQEAGDFQVRRKRLSDRQAADITFFVSNTGSDTPPGFDDDAQRVTLRRAFQLWQEVTNVHFREVFNAEDAYMILGFGTDTHCQLYDMAGASCNTRKEFTAFKIGHCYYPGTGDRAGDCHFNDDFVFTDADATEESSPRLLDVAVHEIGHALGLDHSLCGSALMFNTYDANLRTPLLHPDDVAGVQSLYGSPDRRVAPQGIVRDPTPESFLDLWIEPEADDDDNDGDGVPTSLEVFRFGTDPDNADTDGDGLPDSEIFQGLNALQADTDGDGVSDSDEFADGSDPLTPDRGFDPDTGAEVTGFFNGQVTGTPSPAERLGPNLQAAQTESRPFQFIVRPDGTAIGVVSLFQYGFVQDVGLFGGVNASGQITLLSFDYVYRLTGIFNEDKGEISANGTMEADGILEGNWSAVLDESRTLPPDCLDTCRTAFNGVCEDGSSRADRATCLPGSDCFDCVFTIPADACFNSCGAPFVFNGECNDGRPGSLNAICPPGTDCCDCEGVCRPLPPPPVGDGINCWDLNENGLADPDTEDLNGDGLVNVLDCRGSPGPPGETGSDGERGPPGPQEPPTDPDDPPNPPQEPPPDPGNGDCPILCHRGRTISVSDRAVNAHLAHGDSCGPCP